MPRPRKILPKKRERRAPLAVGTGPRRVLEFLRRNTTLRLLPWQREVIEGIYREKNGVRPVRTAYVSVARGNGKSHLGAAVALYELFRERAHVVLVASDVAQARDITFKVATDLLRDSETLRPLAVVRRGEVLVPSLQTRLQVIPADAPGAQGLHPSAVLFDELHTQARRDLYDALSLGLAPGGVLLATTTAGDNRETICYEVYEYARKVLSGEVADPSWFAYIREAAEETAWAEPATWAAANPALGATLQAADLAQEVARIRETPAALNSFLRQRLNRWTSQTTRWLDPAVWAENRGEGDEAALRGQTCYAGIDLSAISDLTACVLVFPQPDETFGIVCRFWCAKSQLTAPGNRLRDTYQAWQRQGYLKATSGPTVRLQTVIDDIVELSRQFQIREVAIDRLFEGRAVEQALRERGLQVEPMAMSIVHVGAATQLLERLYRERKLRHGGHPILAWMAGNVEVREGPMGGLLPSKKASRDKIDGIVALILALDRYEKSPPSVYERRGILTVEL
jgi:phage terminase large subunit-like protein